MSIHAATASTTWRLQPVPAPANMSVNLLQPEAAAHDSEKLRKTFDAFVGQTFYGQLVKAMRSTQEKPAYFHGGRGEDVFQGQLDQMLVEEVAKNGASQIAEPMFELFNLARS